MHSKPALGKAFELCTGSCDYNVVYTDFNVRQFLKKY